MTIPKQSTRNITICLHGDILEVSDAEIPGQVTSAKPKHTAASCLTTYTKTVCRSDFCSFVTAEVHQSWVQDYSSSNRALLPSQGHVFLR